MEKTGVLLFIVFTVLLVGVGLLYGQPGGSGTGSGGGQQSEEDCISPAWVWKNGKCCPGAIDLYVEGCNEQGQGGGGQGGIQPQPRGQSPLWDWLSPLLNIPQGIVQGFNNIFNVPQGQPSQDNIVPEDDSGNVYMNVPPEEICTNGLNQITGICCFPGFLHLLQPGCRGENRPEQKPIEEPITNNVPPEQPPIEDFPNVPDNIPEQPVPPEEICTNGFNLMTGRCCWVGYLYLLQPGCRGENRPESRPIIEEPFIGDDTHPGENEDCPYWVLSPEGWKCPDSFAGSIYGGDCNSNDDCDEGYICTGYGNNPKICAFISESAETSALASNKPNILEWFKRRLFG